MKKNRMLSLALVLVSLPAFAWSDKGPGPASLFAAAPVVISFSEPYVPRTTPGERTAMRPNVGTLIMGGVLGNILGSLGGVWLGARMIQNEHDVMPLIICWSAGSALGSATGVCLTGHSRYWQGNFGMAMAGGVLGVGLSWLILSSPTFQGNAGILSLAPLLLLPPIGAALGFNSSQRYRSLRAGNGLLNLAEGKLGLGVPDVQVRPTCVPGLKAKPELGFNLKVLSVEL